MDVDGRIAAHTGKECIDWCGHVEGDGFSIAGNMLAGAAVLDETAKAYAAARSCPLAQRLIAAMKAGEAAGGDKRGKQSAALLIHGEEEWPALDLRVDDHADPLAELARLEAVSRERWAQFRNFLPTRENSGRDHRSQHHRRRASKPRAPGDDGRPARSKSKACASSSTAMTAAPRMRSIASISPSPTARRSGSSASPAAARA